jgi:hypothetical protein
MSSFSETVLENPLGLVSIFEEFRIKLDLTLRSPSYLSSEQLNQNFQIQ